MRLPLLILLLSSCGHAPDSGAPAAPAAAGHPETDPAGAPSTAPASAPSSAPPAAPAPGSTIVIARVLSSGPVGSGRCAQCSHSIAVETSVEGGIPANASPIWVHFEWCEGDPDRVEPPGAVNPCSLDVGSRYELRLDPEGSENFPGAPMILEARPH